MEVKFNDKIYKKNRKDGSSLRDLCFNIFEEYSGRETMAKISPFSISIIAAAPPTKEYFLI